MRDESQYKQLVLKYNFLSAHQIANAIKQYNEWSQKEQEEKLFSQFLLGKGFITARQHNRVMEELDLIAFQETDDLRETGHQDGLKEKGISRIANFEIIVKLASGGMGIVYKAKDIRNGDIVALKVLHALDNADEESLKRFKREADVAASVDHPNVVRVREFGLHRNVHFLAMDFVEGKPLSKYRPKKITACVELFCQICDALYELHVHGIIHRDIKSDNILIDLSRPSHPVPKITDFSLAFRENPLETRFTQTGAVLGTPYYMSPEQAMGNKSKIDLRTDIYSFGVLMYEILTGKFPFQAKDMNELYSKIMHGQPAPPSSLRRAIKKDLDRIILKAIARDIQDRYLNCKEMGLDLKACLKGKKLQHSKESLLAQMRRKGLLRKSNLVIALLSFLLLGCLCTIVLLLSAHSSPDSRPHFRKEIDEIKSAFEGKRYEEALQKTKALKKIAPEHQELAMFEKKIEEALRAVLPADIERIERLYLQGDIQKAMELLSRREIPEESRNKAWNLFQRLMLADSNVFWNILGELEQLRPFYFILAMTSSTSPASDLFKAICHFKTNEYPKACALFMEPKPTNPSFFYWRSKIRAFLGDLQGCLDDVRSLRAAHSNPDHSAPIFAFLQTDHLEQLYESVFRAKESGGNKESLLFQVIAHKILRKYKEGAFGSEIYPMLISLANRDKVPGAYLYLAILEIDAKRLSEARYYLQKAEESGVPRWLVNLYRAEMLPLEEKTKELAKVAQEMPDCSEAYLLWGKSCLQANDHACAAIAFEKHVERVGKNVENLGYLGSAYAGSKKEEKALKTWEEALELYHQGPWFPDYQRACMIYYHRGQLFQKQGKIEQALESYRIASDIVPQYTQPLATLLLCYFEREKYYEGFMDAFEVAPTLLVTQKEIDQIDLQAYKIKALGQNMRSLDGLKGKMGQESVRRRAILHARNAFFRLLLQDTKAASDEIEKSFALSSTPEGHWIKAQFSFLTGKPLEALREYEAMLAILPNLPQAVLGKIVCLGEFYSKHDPPKGWHEKLLRAMDSIFSHCPQYRYLEHFTHYANICLYRTAGISDDPGFNAVLAGYYERLIQFSRSNGRHNMLWACYDCGNLYHKLKRNDKAIEMYDRAVWTNPSYFYSYWYRGRMHAKVGNPQKARADYRFAQFLVEGTREAPSILPGIKKDMEKLEFK